MTSGSGEKKGEHVVCSIQEGSDGRMDKMERPALHSEGVWKRGCKVRMIAIRFENINIVTARVMSLRSYIDQTRLS